MTRAPSARGRPGRPRRVPVRIRQRLRDRSPAGCAADRTQLAAEVRVRAVRGATLGLAVHGTARQQRAIVALPDSADAAALGHLPQDRPRPVAHRARPRGRRADRADALGSDPDPRRVAVVPRGRPDDDHGWRRRQSGRDGRARLPDHALDGRRVLLRCRRRAAVRAAAGRAAPVDRVRHHRHRARRDRGHPAGRQAARRVARRPGARLPLRELRRRLHACPSAAPSAPTASPIRAIS